MMEKKNRKMVVRKNTTGFVDNTLRLYLKEIKKIPLLSREEQDEIAREALNGNKAAREKLVSSNLRFVIMVAKKYQRRGLSLEDLISEGNVGLLSAVRNFDPDKGYSFITYAVWWIRQSISKALYEKGRMIRLPSNKSNALTKIEKKRQELHEPGRKSAGEIEEAAAFLNIPAESALALVNISQDVLSLDVPVSDIGTSTALKDLIEDNYNEAPDVYAMNSVLRDDINRMINSLMPRAADIIRCRFGFENGAAQTLTEVGTRLQLTRERVRQIEEQALLQLQCNPGCAKLESYTAG